MSKDRSKSSSLSSYESLSFEYCVNSLNYNDVCSMQTDEEISLNSIGKKENRNSRKLIKVQDIGKNKANHISVDQDSSFIVDSMTSSTESLYSIGSNKQSIEIVPNVTNNRLVRKPATRISFPSTETFSVSSSPI